LLEGGVQPYAFVVTPFVRAAATDLNLTLGLAIVSFFAIQYFGFTALGPNYLQKFINLRALGDMGKRPLGAIDFGVGLFEIISEFAKVISLAFRLFGNIFAGQLLLFIMAFLVAMILPVIFYGLEVIVGFIQALVFAVLTLVFSAQAMVSHHHEEDGEHH
jgi:F-type H+-transporting ATPase subunit a